MRFPSGARLCGVVALALAALTALSSCGRSSPSPDTPSSETPTVPGAIIVSGTERLAWNQAGDVSSLRFIAYVDGSPVALDAATCNAATPEAECSSPLPPLGTGVHTVALAALSASGLESERSESITVQKSAARSVISAASFPDAHVSSGGPYLEATVATPGGLAFAVDVVARRLNAPVQLASTGDGRLLVAEADGRVRVVRPGEPDRAERALDARALLEPPPVGPLGLARHPDFSRNHFVYVSFLAQDGPDRTRLRIVRLREVANALGEPATLFEAPVAVSSRQSRTADDGGVRTEMAAGSSDVGPRLAFGPDGLLYVLLPPGVEFDNEPAASQPRASMLRLRDDGRVPDARPLSGIDAHPLGFGWHPTAATLLGIVPLLEGQAAIQSLGEEAARTLDTGRALLRIAEGSGPQPGALVFEEAQAGTLTLAHAFAEALDHEATGTIRLAVPVLVDGVLDGLSARVIDLVADRGTVYLATNNAGHQAVDGDGGDVVLRLRPRPR
jgi:hypothetical protein